MCPSPVPCSQCNVATDAHVYVSLHFMLVKVLCHAGRNGKKRSSHFFGTLPNTRFLILVLIFSLCTAVSTSSASSSGSCVLSKPMQRKLVALVNCQLVEEEGRSRAMRAARSLGERAVTELILQHQNQQQLSANLWAAVRARGCQFLGPGNYMYMYIYYIYVCMFSVTSSPSRMNFEY